MVELRALLDIKVAQDWTSGKPEPEIRYDITDIDEDGNLYFGSSPGGDFMFEPGEYTLQVWNGKEWVDAYTSELEIVELINV
jgi:hypothetical protein